MAEVGRAIRFGQPLLPPPEAFRHLMDEVFAAQWLTNGGALQQRLEDAVQHLLGGDVTLVSSGTMALMMALRLGNLRPGGDVITSPLSFAASAQAIAWCGFRPVFADVDPIHATLCPAAVEKAVTPRTVAIMAVHFQGVACDVDGLADVARRHGLWLVFDAAQAPDIRQPDGRNLCLAGDATAVSLHATKLLNTAEGGAVITGDPGHRDRLRVMRNFGLVDGQMRDCGVNGKLSELHAALGLAVLPLLAQEMAARQQIRHWYDAGLAGRQGLDVLQPRRGTSQSHLYYTLDMAPALRHRVHGALLAAGVQPRAPFAPLCGPGTAYPDAAIVTTARQPVADRLAGRFLSLPLHAGLDKDAVDQVIRAIVECPTDV